ncbi:MAG TPA: ABC transporter permease [Pyrinomonadaceae bacterium]
MDTLLKDIRYAVRGLIKRPAFSLIAIVTLALGIGANTAIFTLVNAVLLKSLPVPHPEELVLFSDDSSEGTHSGDVPSGEWSLFNYDSYQYLRKQNQSFQDICAFRSGESRLSVLAAGSSSVQRATGHLVTGNYFNVMGVNARLGRTLNADDDRPEASPAAVVSDRYWQQVLNSDPSVVGKTFLINGANFTIVGVTPPAFFGERVRRAPDFWLPLSFQPQVEMRKSTLDDKGVYWLSLMGRLRNVTMDQAQAQTTLALRQYLTELAGSQINDDTRRSIEGTSIAMVSGAGGISGLRLVYSKPLQMLMAIVGMVLLIACANVGSLFLARASGRGAEMSLRLALGASRMRIIRQLLTESLLLAVCGGVAGVLIAQWGVRLLVGLVTKETPLQTRLDLLVLSFTATVAIVAGLLFGLLPAIRASRTDLAGAMKEKSRTNTGRSRFGIASGLVITQICLSMVLLTGAGLFARSLLNLQKIDVGFNPENVLTLDIDPRLGGYKSAELPALYQRVLERLKTMPRVTSVTMSSYAPMSGSRSQSDISISGYTPGPSEKMLSDVVLIGPDFNETMGVPLLQGRSIRSTDTKAEHQVAVVNQAFADHYFKGQNALGRLLCFGDKFEPKDQVEIVGVIGNIKASQARDQANETIYQPILQLDDRFVAGYQIKTSGDAASLGPAVREAIAQVDPKLPIFGVTTLTEQISGTFRQDRLISQLMSFFGALALLLAAIGLYGVMSNGVMRRTNEIGIRMALGAASSNILWLVLKESLILVIVGLVVGVPVALGAGSLIASQLFGLRASDPVTLVVAGAVLILVAVLAGFLPARRASRVDPLVALRDE